jgi:rSAM/selenodomain-associated transferase 1
MDGTGTNAIIKLKGIGRIMKQEASDAVIVFMRAPLQGKVKTRLAKTLGEEKAAEFYRLCAESIASEISQLSQSITKYISFAEKIDGNQASLLINLGFEIAVQEGGDLGERLGNAFAMTLRNGARKVVILASDVPDLTASLINEAISSLDDSDVVIGPSYDGGYYLIGMKELHTGLFHNISWGTEKVYRETLRAIKQEGLVVRQLPILIDIDTEADLHHWLREGSNKNRCLMEFIDTVPLQPG